MKSLKKILVLTAILAVVISLVCISVPVKAQPLSCSISTNGETISVSNSVYSGVSANDAFADAFNHVGLGGTVTVNAGTYTNNGSSIIMADCVGVTVIFESGSLLTLPNNVNNTEVLYDTVFLMQNDINCAIENIQINGNALNQVVVSLLCGVFLSNCDNCTINGGTITNCRMMGAVISNTAQGCNPSIIENCIINYCGWNCIQLGQYAAGSKAINNTCSFASDVGISTYSSCTIEDNTVFNITGYIGGWAGVGTGSHYGLAIESNGANNGQTGEDNWLISNTMSNCTNGIDIGTGNPVNSNYVADNVIFNCNSGILTYLAIGDVITQNHISNWGTNYAWAIATQSSINEIVSLNSIYSSSSSTTLGYIFWVSSCYNCSFFNNTMTTISPNDYGMWIHISNSTLIEYNNYQAWTGIYIDANSYNTRTFQNNLSNCTFGITDNGIDSQLLSLDTLNTTLYFQNSFQGGNANAWSGTTTYNGGPWFVPSPTYSGDAYSMEVKYNGDGAYYNLPAVVQQVEFNFSVYWNNNPGSGQIFYFFNCINNTYDQNPFEVLVNNTGSSIIWGIWICSSTGHFNYYWNTTANPNNGTWYNLCCVANALSTTQGASLYVNNVLTLTAPTIAGYFNQISIEYQNNQSSSYCYIDNCSVQESTGSPAVYSPVNVLSFNCPSIGDTVSPNTGSYTDMNDTQETITLTPNQYSQITALNVDGSNVTLTGDSYTLSMLSDLIVYALFTQTSYPVAVINTYTIGIVFLSPQATVYQGSIPVDLSTSGNDTFPVFNWNVLLANETWLYTTNQTSQTANITGITDTEMVTLCCEVTGANGAVAYGTVTFTVNNGNAPPVYAVPVAIVVVTGGVGAVVAYFYRRLQKSRIQTAYIDFRPSSFDGLFSNYWELD